MSRAEALLTPVGELRDLIDLRAVDMGAAKIIESRKMTFDEVMALE